MTIKITGEEVKQARIAAGYTQQAMADLLGHTLRNYQRKEEGRPDANGEVLSSIMPGEFYFMQSLALGSVPALGKVVNASRKLLEQTGDLARQPGLNQRFAKVFENMEQALSELEHSKHTR